MGRRVREPVRRPAGVRPRTATGTATRGSTETESQGVVAEVLFPNTIPPFFAQSNLTALEPTADDYEQRWAGLQAHNRWLADFCAAAPGRRAGCAQVFLNDLDDTLAEVQLGEGQHARARRRPPPERAAQLGDRCRSGTRTTSRCGSSAKQLDVVINIHSGSGLPDFGQHEAARAIMLIELAWYAHRAVWHLIFGGVLERHPNLRVVLTEQGTSWIPRGLDTLDWFHRRMTLGGAAEAAFFGAATKGMSMTPTEYFQRNFWVGASFLRPSESPLRYDVGVDRIMWGADYPHSEGSYPYTTEALRAAFADVPAAEVKTDARDDRGRRLRFDLPALREIGDRVGPTVAEVPVPLDPTDYPSDSTCNAFDAEQVIKAW